MLAPANIDVDLACTQPSLALPQVAAGPEKKNDRRCEVRLKETLHGIEAAANRADGDVKLFEGKHTMSGTGEKKG